jgi:L-ascorbate metabolism protein UlaG (beta-lactamase superfamily)
VSDAPFAVTFLGHQGWFVRGDDTAILIDPLLCEPFGAAHALDYRVWPPRAWTVGELPPIDAVVLSHEHDDHFDIPSLAKLDRRVAIYLSSRSSPAARGILAAMGFTDVRPLAPGARVAIGALDVLPFTGDHVNVNCGEEWDTLPMIVRHRGGAGSLFTMVDITITPQHVEWARAAVSRPGLVTWTNNSMDWSHMTDWLPVRADATHQAFMKMGTGHKLIASTWGTPAAMLTCAGGFSFAGGDDRAWLNAHAFCVDMEQVCKAMLGVYRKERFVAARPGNTFAMKANRLERVDDRAPFLASVPAAEWPSRAKQAGDPRAGDVPDYAPATGRRELTDAERGELAERVGAVAGELVGGAVFRGLCSLLATEHPRGASTRTTSSTAASSAARSTPARARSPASSAGAAICSRCCAASSGRSRCRSAARGCGTRCRRGSASRSSTSCTASATRCGARTRTRPPTRACTRRTRARRR